MTILFIDSTYDVTIGLLDEQLVWKDFQTFSGQKASSILQTETYRMYKKHGLKIVETSSIVSVAGPGFYTGLRLSEGFCDVMSLFKVPSCTFYSYLVPKLTGVKSGVWATKAYRGEYFFHSWNETSEKNELIEAKNLESYMSSIKSPVFFHSESALDQKMKDLMPERISNLSLMNAQAGIIFSQINHRKPKSESFYFRAPEDEFRTSV